MLGLRVHSWMGWVAGALLASVVLGVAATEVGVRKVVSADHPHLDSTSGTRTTVTTVTVDPDESTSRPATGVPTNSSAQGTSLVWTKAKLPRSAHDLPIYDCTWDMQSAQSDHCGTTPTTCTTPAFDLNVTPLDPVLWVVDCPTVSVPPRALVL